MKLSEFYDFVDENSDEGVPLTFLSSDNQYGLPRFEEAPYHILPGELFSYDFTKREIYKPYICLVLKHDYDYGVELTKDVLLYEILYPQLSQHHKKFFVLTIYDENNEYFLDMLGNTGLWTKIESPERNVFYCQGNSWEDANLKGITGGECAAVSLAY